MNIPQDTIVQLNNYPPDKYNVLIPVTSMQVMSNMQRIIVNEVRLDTTVDEKGSGRDIYRDKQTGKFAITLAGGTKLAAAANISIIDTSSVQPDVCERCVSMAKATGNVQPCGNCPHAYDVKMVVTVRVPEPSGGFRRITKSKEIDCALEQKTQTEAQFRRFLPHRASIAESKAFMRCLRTALGLAQLYTWQELCKPFVIAHIVPNLDAPELRTALINNSLRDMGLLFEQGEQPKAIEQGEPQRREPAALPEGAGGGSYSESEYQDPEGYEPEGGYPADGGGGYLPWEEPPEPQGIRCVDCGKPITAKTGRNGKAWTPEAIKGYSEKTFGRCLCPDCQAKAKGGQRR